MQEKLLLWFFGPGLSIKVKSPSVSEPVHSKALAHSIQVIQCCFNVQMGLSGRAAVIVSGDRGGRSVRWGKWQQSSCFMRLIWAARGAVWVMDALPRSLRILTGYLAPCCCEPADRALCQDMPEQGRSVNLSGLRINNLLKGLCSKFRKKTHESQSDQWKAVSLVAPLATDL